jgi:hypothetical protein
MTTAPSYCSAHQQPRQEKIAPIEMGAIVVPGMKFPEFWD